MIRNTTRTMRENPDNRPSDTDLALIERAAPVLRESLTPASPKAIAMWVEFLLDQYPRRERAPAFADMDRKLWLSTLAHIPEDIIEAGVTQWCAGDNAFPPRVPGQIKKLCDPILAARRHMLQASEQVLALPPPEREEDKVTPGMMQKLLSLAREIGGTKPRNRSRA